ncbi:MAG: alpha-2-macroglobulin [Pseudomonadota bacterium]
MMKSFRRWSVLAALVSLLACRGEDERPNVADDVDPQSLRAPRAAAEEPQIEERFALLRTETNTDGGRPSLCLVFSEPLAPRTDYEPYVEIDRSVALTVRGGRLCVNGLSYGEEVNLTLRKGLPSRSGRELEQDEDVLLSFSDRPPVVSFAGNGVVLPRTGGDGLAITTVNVEAVDVEVRRLNDRALVLKRINEGYSVEENNWRYAPYDEEPGQYGELIFEGQLETPGAQNQAVVTALPTDKVIPDLEPGAYYISIREAQDGPQVRSPARAVRWIVITDLALTAYRGDSGLDVTVRSLQTARPVDGAQVKLISQANEVLGTAESGRDGRVRFARALMNGDGPNTAKLLTVEGGEDFAMLDLFRAPLDLSAHPVGGKTPVDIAQAYIYLDRGIYRPGETIYASALVRDAQGYAVKDRPGFLVLTRPNGLEQARRRFDSLPQAGAMVDEIVLPDAASRGVWRLSVVLDGLGTIGSTSLNVEDFVPQRMALTLEADTDTPLKADEVRMIDVDLQFLYGAPGSGLTVSGTARIEEDPSPFDGYRGFSFGMSDKAFRQLMINIPDATTDGAGRTSLPLKVGQRGADASMPLRVRTVVRAEEPGGRAISDDIRVPYRPQECYVGIKPGFEGSAERGKPVNFDLVALDREGKPSEQTVDWRLRRRDYDYDWYRDESGRWRWRRSERIVRVAEGTAATGADGEASIELSPLPWGDYELVASLDNEDRVSTTFWVGYGGRSADGTPAPDSVRVLGPSGGVKVGEDAAIAITAPYPGLAEVAVATGSVLSVRHIEVPEDGAEITVPVTEDWGAGAYVLVTVYTDRDPKTRPIPRRAVGAAYVPVNVDSRTLNASLSVPERVRPNRDLNVELAIDDLNTDEPIFATLALVDEGILLLTKHQSPDPVDAIFGKMRLGVDLYDDYGRILDPNRGEPGVVRSGGDAIGGAGLSAVPIKTVALFEGSIALDADGRATIPVTLPDFNGALRLMAAVWSDSALGSASTPLTVRDAVPTELILPRFLAPGDEAQATLTMDNVEGAPGEYTVEIASADEGSTLTIDDSEKSITLDPGVRNDLTVALTANATGTTELTVDVSGPDSFQAQRGYPFEVRGAFLPQTTFERLVLQPGEQFVPGANAFSSLVEGSEKMLISASGSPIDPITLTQSLLSYPYLCTEQLTSTATALLFKRDRTGAETARLQKAVDTLLERQGTSGAFGMWRVDDRRASPWLGAYATDFLSRAAEQKLRVPEEALKRAYDALTPISQGEMRRAYGYDTRSVNSPFTEDSFQRLDQRAAAYALYVLSRAGRVDRSRLRYAHDAQIEAIESPMARAHIGAALAALGDRGRAQNAFDQAEAASGYRNNGDWYQSPLRDDAARAELLAEAGFTDEAASLLQAVAEQAPEVNRMGTQEKAFIVRAASALTGRERRPTLTYGEDQFTSAMLTRTDDLQQPFENKTRAPLYVSVQTTGVPTDAPPATASSLTLTKDYFTPEGNLIVPANIKQGDRLIVRLAVTPNRRAQAQYILADLLPAGFEIETVLSSGDGAPNGPFTFLGRLTDADVAEARDDRFVASDILRDTQTRQYAYIVRAVTPGDFTLPGAVAEDMYRADVFARTASSRVQIAP